MAIMTRGHKRNKEGEPVACLPQNKTPKGVQSESSTDKKVSSFIHEDEEGNSRSVLESFLALWWQKRNEGSSIHHMLR